MRTRVIGNQILFRASMAPALWGPVKWGAVVVVLLMPGSFFVLPLLWFAGRLKGAVMDKRESGEGALRRTGLERIVRRMCRWWQYRDAAERYLAEAGTHAELERRMRSLERGRGGAAFVTFNH